MENKDITPTNALTRVPETKADMVGAEKDEAVEAAQAEEVEVEEAVDQISAPVTIVERLGTCPQSVGSRKKTQVRDPKDGRSRQKPEPQM